MISQDTCIKKISLLLFRICLYILGKKSIYVLRFLFVCLVPVFKNLSFFKNQISLNYTLEILLTNLFLVHINREVLAFTIYYVL